MWIKRSLVVVFAAACALMMSGCHGLFGAFLTGLTGQVPPGFDDDHEEDSCAETAQCDLPIPKVAIVIPSNYLPGVGERITLSATSTPPANGPVAWDTNGDGEVGGAGDAAAGNPVTASFDAPGIVFVTAAIPTSQGQVVGFAPITVVEGGATTPTQPPGSRGGIASPAGTERLRASAPRFSLRLTGASIAAGRLSTSRERISLRRAIGLGEFRLRISGSPPTVQTGTAISGASLRIDRDTGRRVLAGAVLAQLDDTVGATCLTFRLKAPSDEPLGGRLRVLGGPGETGALTGRGRVSDGKVKGNGPARSLRVRGTIRTHSSESIKLPARCAKLQARAL